MKYAIFIATAILTTVETGGAFAQDRYQSQQLFRKGAWDVELTYDSVDDEFWCSASTTNSRNQNFSLTRFEEAFGIFVFDPTWNIAARPVSFQIDVDYKTWNMNGNGEQQTIAIFPDDFDKATDFLTDVMQGNAVAVKNSSGRRLAQFSLTGSYAAILNLIDCWNKVAPNDPFAVMDPF